MAGGEGPSRKRSFEEDGDDFNKHPPQKRVRFPKGKKVKTGDSVVEGEDVPGTLDDPRVAANQRAMKRNQLTAKLLEENRETLHNISRAEVQYENDETFVDDGIAIEPFNLRKEREEGYFDASGNYVEYVKEDEIKDSWLDGIDARNVAARPAVELSNEDDVHDLSGEDIGKMKRRIADILEPGETVLRALRRLKGTSNNKEKMPSETKRLFDQLTEDAMLLMENGDHNVYDEDQATFLREAEGYEKLAEARRKGASADPRPKKSDTLFDEDSTLNEVDIGRSDLQNVTSGLNSSAPADNTADTYDMFAEDDETTAINPVANQSDPDRDGTDLQNDYVYDDPSGYYYSSSLGYYYDPSSGLYCCAASGQWYSYNEESGSYDEVQQVVPTES